MDKKKRKFIRMCFTPKLTEWSHEGAIDTNGVELAHILYKRGGGVGFGGANFVMTKKDIPYVEGLVDGGVWGAVSLLTLLNKADSVDIHIHTFHIHTLEKEE